MIKKCILPVTKPMIDCYSPTSSAVSILQNNIVIKKWLYNNFIQIFEVQGGALDFFDFSIENNPFLIYSEIPYALVHSKWKNISDFIVEAIADGNYVRLYVNKSKCSLYVNPRVFPHDMLIYGYDIDKAEFYVGDHFKHGIFSFEKMTFSTLDLAYDTNYDDMTKFKYVLLIQLIKPELEIYRLQMDYTDIANGERESLFELSCSRIKQSISDYINACPTTGWYTRIRGLNEKVINDRKWGINCYEVLKRHIGELKENPNARFSRQSFYVEYLHKSLMIERINELKNIGRIKNVERHLMRFEELKQENQAIMFLFLKLKSSPKERRNVTHLLELINITMDKEYKYFEELNMDII